MVFVTISQLLGGKDMFRKQVLIGDLSPYHTDVSGEDVSFINASPVLGEDVSLINATPVLSTRPGT